MGRDALAELIGGIPGALLVATESEPLAAAEAALREQPDVLVVDDRLLGGGAGLARDVEAPADRRGRR